MEQIFNSLKSLVDPLVGKAADTLGENTGKVSKAATSILAGLLTKLTTSGGNQQMEEAMKDAANANLVSHLGAVFGTKGEVEQVSIGNKLFRALLGSRTQEFTDAVAADSGISKSNAAQLTNMVSSAVGGFFGDKVKNGGFRLCDLVSDLNNQKSSFMGLLPAGLGGVLGLASPGLRKTEPVKKKGGLGWLLWLLVAIALILLIIFGWRSCKNKKATEVVQTVEQQTERVVDNAANAVKEVIGKTLTEFTLPNGVKIQAYKNGMEDKMIAFLNSDAYKNAKTDADLSKKWFEFEDVDFARDSATELNSGMQHVNNIAAILNAYPNAKIKVGGNADKSGNRLYNMEISKERATTIKKLLTEKSVAANRISIEGFGDEHAVWPADATASQSESDRDIAFRFTK